MIDRSSQLGRALVAAPDGYTEEDPAAIWNGTSSNLLTFTQGVDTAPSAKNASYLAPFGPLIQLQLQFSIAGGSPGGTFTPSISIDLNLKGD